MTDPRFSDQEIRRFLDNNPEYLLESGIMDALAGPHGSSGQVVDLSQVVLNRARDVMRRTRAAGRSMVNITAENQIIQGRVHHACCLLIAARSSEEIARLILDSFPDILDTAAATLIVPDTSPLAQCPYVLSLDGGYIARLTGGARFSLGRPVGLQGEIFRQQLKSPPASIAVAALPTILPREDVRHGDASGDLTHGSLLALAGKDEHSFTEGHGTDLLEFTVRMIAIGLLARGVQG
ncbi:DUF484 family protein [Alphaproteobacteria bacterium LSUCC0684]